MNGLERMEQRAQQQIEGQVGIPPVEVDGIPLTERPIDSGLLVGGMSEQLLRRKTGKQVPLSALPKKTGRTTVEAPIKDPYAVETHWGSAIIKW